MVSKSLLTVAFASVALLSIGSSPSGGENLYLKAQRDRAFQSFNTGWEVSYLDGKCVLKQRFELPESLRRLLNNPPEQPNVLAATKVLDTGDNYIFEMRKRASDELQFRVWQSGGITSKSATGRILSPALGHGLSLSSDDRSTIWMETFEFKEEDRLLIARAEVSHELGLSFLLGRAEAGVMYGYVPSEHSPEEWKIRLKRDFRGKLASFIACQEQQGA